MSLLRVLRGEFRYLRRRGFAAWVTHLYEDEGPRVWLFRWFWLVSFGFLVIGSAVILLRLLRRA